MSQYKTLKKFKPEELLLNEEETIIVLKFIFKPVDHPIIDQLPMTDALREFAQGLLVEAIDASYAVGFIQGLMESVSNPSNSALKVIKRFARKAGSHWFEHATVHELFNAKIYEFVVDAIARQFRSSLKIDFLARLEQGQSLGTFLSYKKPSNRLLRVWC